jgi:hypothetical protein
VRINPGTRYSTTNSAKTFVAKRIISFIYFLYLYIFI